MLNLLVPALMSLCATAPAGPGRVAVIFSSGVDRDFRCQDEYDDPMRQLGWPRDRYQNTELDKLMPRLGEYGLIYTIALWNYGDSQDFSRWTPALRQWLEAGGCLVLTDMAYGPHLYVPPLLGEHLEVACENCKQTVFSPTFTSQVITQPNHVGGEPFWAHFSHWGTGYQVGAECGEGKPVLLTAGIGKGLLVVTTTWHHDAGLIANLWAAAEGARRGVVLLVEQPPTPLLPGEGQIPVALVSYRDAAQSFTLKVTVRPKDAAAAKTGSAQEEAMPVTLAPREWKAVQVPYRLPCRGPMDVRASALMAGGAEAEAQGTVVVPPPLEVNVWGRHVLRGSFPAVDVTTNMPAGRGDLKVAAYLDETRLWQTSARRGAGRELALPPTPGIQAAGPHDVSFVLTEAEQTLLRSTVQITVDEGSEPGSRVEVRGRQVLVNGRPFFPLGTYHVGVGDFKALREHGFNCFTGPIYAGDQPTLADDQRAFFEAAHRQGLMVLSELSEFLRGERFNTRGAANIASELVPYPALLCQYLVDEPYPSIGPDVVGAGYRAVARADRFHPQLVCLNDANSFGYYTKVCDIYSCDPYPIPREGGAKSVKGVAEVVDLMRAKWPTGPIWVAIQSHRNPPPMTDDARWIWPTPEQVRCMSFLALNHGGTGLMFYAWGDVDTDASGQPRGSGFAYNRALFDSYRDLLPVLADLGPRFVTGLQPATGLVPPGSLDAALVRDGRRRLLSLVNPISEPREATVDLTAAHATRLTPCTPFTPPPKGATVALPGFGVGVYEVE